MFSVIISAPSGAGKTTLIEKLLIQNPIFEFAISTTTRVKRAGEAEGKNYYYVSYSEFMQMVDRGDFLEWAKVHDNYYGTTKKEVDRIKANSRIPIFDVDVQGARSLRNKLQNVISVFIIPPSIKELERRLRHRSTETDHQITVRLNNAIGELREYVNYDYIVVNDDLQKALDELNAILKTIILKREYMDSVVKRLLEDVHDYTIR
ncbi:MAG: guanylate kinase [Spirochaetes bacterium]|nr:guanylate kinase [Spirochaetota bacterium]NMB64205.1 guanylate kinase [Spirochaetota bacterium]HOJ28518.1 guanylate kinase [Spirochaetota bacterium]HOM10421.1 guanylate kinase [Spirochaetota bacterium]HPP49105.1 guanylate kinase [Spirochaetota bacterium]